MAQARWRRQRQTAIFMDGEVVGGGDGRVLGDEGFVEQVELGGIFSRWHGRRRGGVWRTCRPQCTRWIGG